jgi:hypothetical protein
MSGWTLLIIAFLGVVTLRAIAGKYLPRSHKPTWMILILILVLLAGAFLTLNCAEDLSYALQRKDWPTAKGRVIRAETDTTGTIRPIVTYAYEVGGRAYFDSTDLQAPGFGNQTKQYELAKELIRFYPVGREIEVHYDPADESHSVLITSPSWRIFGQLGLGMILFAASLFFLILPQQKTGIMRT